MFQHPPSLLSYTTSPPESNITKLYQIRFLMPNFCLSYKVIHVPFSVGETRNSQKPKPSSTGFGATTFFYSLSTTWMRATQSMPLETTLFLLEKSQIKLNTLDIYYLIFLIIWSITLTKRTEPVNCFLASFFFSFTIIANHLNTMIT